MTLTEQFKILDDKIKANKAQYDLDREAAKVSALSSGELEKYEYLTGEDLGHKLDVIQIAKFEYSPLCKVFNKELDESDKKEGFLKRLKNIERQDEEQLKAIKYQREKQLQILTKKTDTIVDFKNVSFRSKVYSESKEPIMKLRNKVKRLIIQNLSALAQ